MWITERPVSWGCGVVEFKGVGVLGESYGEDEGLVDVLQKLGLGGGGGGLGDTSEGSQW